MGRRRSGCGHQHLASFAKEFDGVTGLGEQARRAAQLGELFPDADQIGEVTSEHEHAAGREFAVEVVHQLKAAATGHSDIAEQQVGRKAASDLQCLVRRVGYLRLEAIFAEDDTEGIGYKGFVVDDQNAMHNNPFREVFGGFHRE
jgi:hypothetical protein